MTPFLGETMKNLFFAVLIVFGLAPWAQADVLESQYQDAETSYIRPGPRPAPYPGNPRPDPYPHPNPRPNPPAPYPNPYPGPGPGVEYITCESWNYYYQECYFNPYRIHSVRLYNVISYDACLYNNTYGIYGDRVWVNRGCRAIFEVIRY
ncbi:conserved hypothetical protein [Bdellovibrio bacteriovorus HD100]|uniref:DUF3011 domain-containing protein n=2 Tax=Bdellovibrio bacteriovorus TaxID=959 RepID=Q6MPS0_BDEBA|nr:conserved hypothetical protein [Bdellovibrio bacteriovorus HD100]